VILHPNTESDYTTAKRKTSRHILTHRKTLTHIGVHSTCSRSTQRRAGKKNMDFFAWPA